MQSLPFKNAGRMNGSGAIATMALTAVCLGGAATAGDLEITVEGLRNDVGAVRVAVCPRGSFLTTSCPHTGSFPAPQAGIRIRDVLPGTYAIQAFHDENGNGEFDRTRFGRPLEGMAFSRDAQMRRGPPNFADAAFRLGDDTARATLTMRYFE
jgi:uncharacterized protein (DUF2141 family)